MFSETIDEISESEWQEAIAAHLTWGKTWPGDLSADTFFSLWSAMIEETEPLVLTIRLDQPEPTIVAPADSPLTVEGNRVIFDDGRELILQFAVS